MQLHTRNQLQVLGRFIHSKIIGKALLMGALAMGTLSAMAQVPGTARQPGSAIGNQKQSSSSRSESAGNGGSMDLTKRELGKGITVQLPELMEAVPDQEKASRYLMITKPIAAYWVPKKPVDFTLSVARTVWKDEDIKLLQDFYRANLKSLYTSIEFRKDAIETVNKKKYAVFEYVSEVSEKGKNPVRKYSYVQYTVANNSVLIFHFSAPAAEEGYWKATAAKVMKSIKL